MSSEYFGLIMDPFETGPDPRFLYMDSARRNVFAQLLSAVYECKGLVLLACRRGLGKSTLVRHLSDQLAALDSVLLLYPGGVLSCRPGMTFVDILASCRGRLDRRNKNASDEERLPATLEQAAGRGQAVALILDDADALDDAALSRLGALCGPDGDDRRALSVILVGSAELGGRLERLGIRDGEAEPADLFLELPPLRDRDIDRMVHHRLVVAGHGDGNLFTPVALAEVARRSRGEPLRVVALCGAALTLAEQERKATVSRELVERAADRAGDLEATGPAPVAVGLASSRSRFDEQRTDEKPRSLRLPAAEPDARGPVRRLDDVAEAIRAADRRSSGSADPHIRFAPASPRPVEREPHPSADERAFSAQPHGMADQAYALYPGIRPSGTRAPRRRSGVGRLLALGLALVLLTAGVTYVVRAGMVDLGGISAGIQALVHRVVQTVGSLTQSDPNIDDSVAGISPRPDGSNRDAGTTDLSFGRFGSQTGREDVRPGEAYDFAPPPPQASAEPASRDAAADGQPGRNSASQGAPAAPVAPPKPAAPSPDHGVAATGGSQPTPGGGAPAAAPDTGAASATAGSALSYLRPPEMKPAPPQPAPSATPTARPAPPRSEEPPPARPDAARAQQNEPLLARGDEYLGSGDLDMARTFYQMAFERGSAEAAIRMGWTFDPQYFQRIGLRGEASPREAILWYQEALRRGSSQASSRLSDLATWLQSAAASGDLEAQRILRMWQG